MKRGVVARKSHKGNVTLCQAAGQIKKKNKEKKQKNHTLTGRQNVVAGCKDMGGEGRGGEGGVALLQVALLLRVCNRFESYIKTEPPKEMAGASW